MRQQNKTELTLDLGGKLVEHRLHGGPMDGGHGLVQGKTAATAGVGVGGGGGGSGRHRVSRTNTTRRRCALRRRVATVQTIRVRVLVLMLVRLVVMVVVVVHSRHSRAQQLTVGGGGGLLVMLVLFFSSNQRFQSGQIGLDEPEDDGEQRQIGFIGTAELGCVIRLLWLLFARRTAAHLPVKKLADGANCRQGKKPTGGVVGKC